jgi:hypothetical protein
MELLRQFSISSGVGLSALVGPRVGGNETNVESTAFHLACCVQRETTFRVDGHLAITSKSSWKPSIWAAVSEDDGR